METKKIDRIMHDLKDKEYNEIAVVRIDFSCRVDFDTSGIAECVGKEIYFWKDGRIVFSVSISHIEKYHSFDNGGMFQMKDCSFIHLNNRK